MSQRGDRRVRRELGRLRKERAEICRELLAELENAPFKYRFRFAMKLLFHRKKNE